MLIEKFLCCFQTEDCTTLLKKLSSADAECVIERLTSWARLQLQDKRHISDEVRRGKMNKGHLNFMYLRSSLNFLEAILRPLNDMMLDFKNGCND